jgi:hypothetical protein
MTNINNAIDFDLDFKAIESRRERIRKTWRYERIDHVPLGLYVIDNKEGFTRKEIETDKEKNLRFDLNSVKKSLELLPDDYIPFIKPEVGCATIPTILGSEVYFPQNIDNYSTVKESIVNKITELEKLDFPETVAEIKTRGLMPLNLEKIHYYRNVTSDAINFTGFDIGGVMCGSVDIMNSSLFYISLLTEKDRMLAYLEKLSNLYVAVQKILTGEIGGPDRMTNVDWDVSWYPEGRKGYVSDDPCANFSAEIFETFSKPFNERIYELFGYGGFHNCGPHPCVQAYIDYRGNRLKAVNCSLEYTYKELDSFISVFKESQTVLYFLFEEEFYNAKKALELYDELIGTGTKYNVICIPSYAIDSSLYSDDQIEQIYRGFLNSSTDYAGSLKLK